MRLEVEDFLLGLRKNFKMLSEATGVIGQLLTPDMNNTNNTNNFYKIFKKLVCRTDFG